jgi:TetR/AcrR family transcriptional regulator, transcriptional repressor of aconitase
MPKISEDQRQARRDQILAAAWRCFSRRGVHATSMEEIIREADLSAGALYLYYKSKDELILAAISTYTEELGALLAPILMREEASPPAGFVREMTKAITSHTRRKGLDLNAIILMCWGEAQSNERVKDLIAGYQMKYRDALTQVVRQWQKRGEITAKGRPAEVGQAMHSFFLGFIVQSALLGEINPDSSARGIEGLIASQPPRHRAANQRQAR